MVKVGRLIKPDQPLCYAHGIQLAVIDVIYKQNTPEQPEIPDTPEADQVHVQNTPDDEAVEENDETDLLDGELDNDEDGSFNLLFPRSDVSLVADYSNTIKKVRKVVKLFKNSPTKTMYLLQKYMMNDMGKNIALLLDCKTRWLSLAEMITLFIKTRSCVAKALVD